MARIPNRDRPPRALVAGDFMVDVILAVQDADAPERPDAAVPAYRVGAAEAAPGGAGTCARLLLTAGIDVWPCGTIGDDAFGRLLVAEFERRGADSSLLTVVTGQPTRQRHWITDGTKPTMRFDVDPGRGAPPAPPGGLHDFDLVVVSDFGLGGADGLQHVPGDDRPAHSVVATMDARLAAAFAWADVLVTGVDDHAALAAPLLPHMSDLTGGRVMEPLARAIRAAGFAGAVVVTAGADGALLLDRDGAIVRYATRSARVRNVVGAGDTFVAAMSAALVRGAAVPAAVETGMNAAAASVGYASIGLPSLAGFFA